jgi:molybdopterin biosynthesis enzyme
VTRDAVSTLLQAAEALRAAVRPLETVEIADASGRQDLRDLIAGVRRAAFVAVSLGAIEIRAEGTGAAGAGSGPRRVVM